MAPSGPDSLRALAMARVPWSLELRRAGDHVEFITTLENEYIKSRKEVGRLLLFSVIDTAFFRGVDIREAKRGADVLFAALEGWVQSGFTMNYVVDILGSEGLQVPRLTAHVIASSVHLWHNFPDRGSYRYTTGSILGRLSRSDMVDNREGILGRWRWIRPPTRDVSGEASTPIIVSLVRDRLFDALDLHSVVEGIAMLPPDVRKSYSFNER